MHAYITNPQKFDAHTWMPSLGLNDTDVQKLTGFPPHTAALVAALFPLGGIGAVLFGWMMDRYSPNLVIAAGFAATAQIGRAHV